MIYLKVVFHNREMICIQFNHKLACIPYPADQVRHQEGLLRGDRHFRTHVSFAERQVYRLRSSIERVNSRFGAVML